MALPRWNYQVFLLFALSFTASFSSLSAPITQSYTNSTPANVDPNQNSPVDRSVNIPSTDFPNGVTVDDVIIAIDFDKRDRNNGVCSNYNGGLVYNNEIFFRLSKPSEGVISNLIPFNTYSGNVHPAPTAGGYITVVLDDSAGTTVGGGTPVAGTFRPVNPLNVFDGIDPSGTWTLTMADSAAQDPLCFSSFTLTIEASAQVDISVSKSDLSATYTPGSNASYIITINNSGPDDAFNLTVNDTLPDGVISSTWTCSGSGGAVCGTANGTGNITGVSVDVPSGDSVQFTVDVTFSDDPTDY
ncbi:DUF11 domain-containing protein [Kangiella sp. HD9-110m-PIT-SAG07]|nr:DUF11 domain-containing protein [Kangiella sp. HD9-110m-PIT-SAG07]